MKVVSEHFVPVKIHVKEQPAVFERFKAQWTPTQLILDGHGIEHHRIEGFLPKEDFIAELELGLGKLAFEEKRYEDAATMFRVVCDEHAGAGAAPEACYWAGVSNYKGGNHESLKETARLLKERYGDSAWARKASVWTT